MTSPYNTRSTRSASATTSSSTGETPATTPRRHFCIVLTNNARMIQTAQRMLQTMPVNVPTQSGQQQQQQSGQQQQQQLPHVQMQYLQVPAAPIRARRRRVDEQIAPQVPRSALAETTALIATNMRAYENEIEVDFRAQVQPILQLYLQKTRRPHPINLVLDMSSYIQP